MTVEQDYLDKRLLSESGGADNLRNDQSFMSWRKDYAKNEDNAVEHPEEKKKDSICLKH